MNLYGLKLDSLEYIFVADCSLYAYLHAAWRGELRNLTEIAKIAKKTPYVGSKLFEVIEFCTNRAYATSCYRLWLVVTWALTVSRKVSELRLHTGQHAFSETYYPCLITPSLSEYVDEPYIAKTQSQWTSYYVHSF